MKAFAVTSPGFPGMVSYRSADTASQARYDTWVQARRAGFTVTLMEFKVARIPKLDPIAVKREYIGGYDRGEFSGKAREFLEVKA